MTWVIWILVVDRRRKAGKLLQTRVKRQCLDRVFCDLMHCYVEPGARASLQDFTRWRSRNFQTDALLGLIFSGLLPAGGAVTATNHNSDYNRNHNSNHAYTYTTESYFLIFLFRTLYHKSRQSKRQMLERA